MTTNPSLWNAGGFLWEQKDHSALALAALTSALPTLEAFAPCEAGGCVHVRVTGLHGEHSKVEASVSLRKDKVMPLFDFTLCVTWEALWVRPPSSPHPPPPPPGGGGSTQPPPPTTTLPADPGVKMAAGELRTSGIGPDDVGEEFPVVARLTQAPATPTPALAALVALAKDTASGTLATLLRRTLRAMAGWLLTLDTREDLIAAGVARRAEEEERVKRVGGGVRSTHPTPVAMPSTTGGGGEGVEGGSKGCVEGVEASPKLPPLPTPPTPTIINPSSSSSASASSSSSSTSLPLLSAAAAHMASTAGATAVSLPVASHRVESAGAPPELQPSKWNRAGWGYEDKDMTPWAHKHLKSKLTGFDIDVKGGHLRIVEVDITGEASKIISRGNTGVIFDLSFVAKWEGTLVDGKGESGGTGDGEVVVTDLDQDSFVLVKEEGKLELPLKISACADGGELDERLTQLFIAHGTALLRARLAEFVAELKAQE